MADEQRAIIEPESSTQDAPVPSAEQQTPEPVEAVEVADASQEAKTVEPAEELTLPDDAKERTTQQFEKLKNELATEREKRTRLERAFAKSPSKSQPDSKLPEWYNPDSGTVDVEKLSQREQTLQNEIASLRNQVSGVTRLSEKQQEVEAYKAYPELNPKGKQFDEDFQKQVISHLATEYAEGKAPTIKDAANNITKLAQKFAKRSEKEGAKKALEGLSPKEQAALEATGRSDKRLPSMDYGALRAKTRAGGRTGAEAAMQRLSKISSVGK